MELVINTRRRLWALAAAASVLAAFGMLAEQSAAAGGRNSIRIVMPRHIKIGKPATIKLTGYSARSGDDELSLFSAKPKCRATFDAETSLSNVTEWVNGTSVHGHYRYSKSVPYPESTHGWQHFCAYLTYVPGITTTIVTVAHDGLRFRIPY